MYDVKLLKLSKIMHSVGMRHSIVLFLCLFVSNDAQRRDSISFGEFMRKFE